METIQEIIKRLKAEIKENEQTIEALDRKLDEQIELFRAKDPTYCGLQGQYVQLIKSTNEKKELLKLIEKENKP